MRARGRARRVPGLSTSGAPCPPPWRRSGLFLAQTAHPSLAVSLVMAGPDRCAGSRPALYVRSFSPAGGSSVSSAARTAISHRHHSQGRHPAPSAQRRPGIRRPQAVRPVPTPAREAGPAPVRPVSWSGLTAARFRQPRNGCRSGESAGMRTPDLMHVTNFLFVQRTWPNSTRMLIRQPSQGRILPSERPSADVCLLV
jgi:hypothetical protein